MPHSPHPPNRRSPVPGHVPAVLALALALAGCAVSAQAPVISPSAALPSGAVLADAGQPRDTAAPLADVSAAPVPPPLAEAPLPAATVHIAPLDGVAPQGGLAAPPKPATAPADGLLARGMASWYGPRFHGRRTASGERYDMHALTAAHKTLPFGARVRVRSVHTGKEVVVRINDRGPYKHQRIIDLSRGAVVALGVLDRGVTEVELLRE